MHNVQLKFQLLTTVSLPLFHLGLGQSDQKQGQWQSFQNHDHSQPELAGNWGRRGTKTNAFFTPRLWWPNLSDLSLDSNIRNVGRGHPKGLNLTQSFANISWMACVCVQMATQSTGRGPNEGLVGKWVGGSDYHRPPVAMVYEYNFATKLLRNLAHMFMVRADRAHNYPIVHVLWREMNHFNKETRMCSSSHGSRVFLILLLSAPGWVRSGCPFQNPFWFVEKPIVVPVTDENNQVVPWDQAPKIDFNAL